MPSFRDKLHLTRFLLRRLSAQGHRGCVALESRGLSGALARAGGARSAGTDWRRPTRELRDGSGRVLFLARALPTPDRDSGSERIVQLLRLLRALGCEIDFAAEEPAAPRARGVLEALGVCVVDAKALRSHPADAAASRYRTIVVCRYFLAEYWLPLLRWKFPRAKLIVDTVDLHFLREQRGAGLRGKRVATLLARETERRELRVVSASDETWVVSPAEHSLLQARLPRARITVVPNVHEAAPGAASFADRHGLLFVGGAGHPPNVDAVHWLIASIYPLIACLAPAIRLHLAGPGLADAFRGRLPGGVTCHDYVEDLGPLLASVRIGVAPLRFGAGIKGKVGQYLAHGIPVVGTPCAVEGMHLEHERDVLVASDATAFAEEVVRLHEDPALWNRLAAAGPAAVRSRFSPDAVAETLRASVMGSC